MESQRLNLAQPPAESVELLRNSVASTAPNFRKIIGVIGGIASGKSAARRILQELGAEVLDADAIAHEVLERRAVADEVAKELDIQDLYPNVTSELSSSDCRDATGCLEPSSHVKVDRKKVAKVVFGESLEAKIALQKLEGIVQPKIAEAIQEVISKWKSAKGPALLVLDIPLLFERGWDHQCHEVWFIDTPIAMRRKFAEARGWSADQLAMREQAQLSVDEKRIRADVVIKNDSDLKHLESSILQAAMNTLGLPSQPAT